MKWKRYFIGTTLLFAITSLFRIIVSGFVLLYSWAWMQNNNVLKPAQGGMKGLVWPYIILLIASFIITIIYLRLKKAENPLIAGPIIAFLYSLPEFSNYFLFNIPSFKVPFFIFIQYFFGFTIGLMIFRKIYSNKWLF